MNSYECVPAAHYSPTAPFRRDYVTIPRTSDLQLSQTARPHSLSMFTLQIISVRDLNPIPRCSVNLIYHLGNKPAGSGPNQERGNNRRNRSGVCAKSADSLTPLFPHSHLIVPGSFDVMPLVARS